MKKTNLKDHIVVCGFNALSEGIIQDSLKSGKKIVVIEREVAKLMDLKKLHGIVVVEGNVLREETLEEAGVQNASTIIFTLSTDADCVMGILEAKRLNPKIHCITRIKNKDHHSAVEHAGADKIISTTEILQREFISAIQKS